MDEFGFSMEHPTDTPDVREAMSRLLVRNFNTYMISHPELDGLEPEIIFTISPVNGKLMGCWYAKDDSG